MALIDFQQEDTAATHAAGCSARSDGVTTAGRQANSGGSAGSTPVTVDPDNLGSLLACATFLCSKPGAAASWDAGTWVVRINFSSGDAGTTLEEVHVCDNNGGTIVDIDVGGGGTQATGLGVSTSAGAQTVNVTQNNGHTPQSAADSQPHIVLVFSSVDEHGATSIDITPSLVIDSPVDDGAAAGTPYYYNQLLGYGHGA